MHALHNLIAQSQEIIVRHGVPKKGNETADKFSLIVNSTEAGPLELTYTEVPEFELVDELCRSANFFKSLNWSQANLRRQDLFNQMLLRNDIEPAYIGLPDDVAKLALDAATDLMIRRVGRTKLNGLISGELRLKQLGLETETIELLEKQIGRPVYRFTSAHATLAVPAAAPAVQASLAPPSATAHSKRAGENERSALHQTAEL